MKRALGLPPIVLVLAACADSPAGDPCARERCIFAPAPQGEPIQLVGAARRLLANLSAS